MAETRGRKSTHAYQKFNDELKNGQIKSPLFFYGREAYLIDWAVDMLVKKYVNPAVQELNFARLSGDEIDFNGLRNQCETLPMMSDKRVILVENFLPLSGKKLKGFGEEAEQELLAYIQDLPETTLLIFTAETADKRRKLYKELERCGGCYDFKELDEKLLRSFIEKRLRIWKKKAGAGSIAAFIEASGYFDKETDYTLYNLENDLKKAAAHSSGETVRTEDFLGTVSGNAETNVFAMIDAMSKGRKDEAFHLLHNSLASGDSEYRLLALICGQFEIMLSVKEMQEEGMSHEAICRRMGVHEFRIKKASAFAGHYSVSRIRKILMQAYQVDKKIKTGLMEGRLALELLVAGM